jgi:hypothetical protein
MCRREGAERQKFIIVRDGTTWASQEREVIWRDGLARPLCPSFAGASLVPFDYYEVTLRP